ncbi:MAG: ABC transporter ATP-binding protein [Verrucomicrobiota bacterium]|nr:ABC transporter ATP-binding protein [Verrucomicrobiota bacterium]MEC9327150.1 ABC transporter ATP-binding protein [Verrucomicrobiota bacterium]MEE2725286.1 ABC transporter ATP-binding protein [Verrucomicrobiota bacterium]
MIKVSNLSKQYVERAAVDNISFEVESGEIVGFLGPNGAGKTTTLRMLTGYIPPTSGTASIGGHDVFSESIKARQKIGYMPENVPLYDDMRVREYLRFRAELKGLRGQEARQGVNEAIDLCGLKQIRRQIISSLSKGYRQRVGLADALVNNPELLILDEPTNGLDPNQIRRFRELIKQLGIRHTILISTHILSEVEMTCNRVIILNEGKIIANDKPKDLSRELRSANTISIEIKTSTETAQNLINAIPGIKKVTKEHQAEEWSHFTIRTEPGNDVRESIVHLANAQGWPLREIRTQYATLEDAFVEITQANTSNS